MFLEEKENLTRLYRRGIKNVESQILCLPTRDPRRNHLYAQRRELQAKLKDVEGTSAVVIPENYGGW
ncbi:hypothetical protein [Xanthomonas phage JGB6]|nr:hypothetical protein [Xanthomonas phage JGB6]